MKHLLLTIAVLVSSCVCAPVDYDINSEGVLCSGYDDKYVYSGEYCTIVSCIWYCNSYGAHDCAYVDLMFTSCDGQDFVLDSSFIDDDGICGS